MPTETPANKVSRFFVVEYNVDPSSTHSYFVLGYESLRQVILKLQEAGLKKIEDAVLAEESSLGKHANEKGCFVVVKAH